MSLVGEQGLFFRNICFHVKCKPSGQLTVEMLSFAPAQNAKGTLKVLI